MEGLAYHISMSVDVMVWLVVVTLLLVGSNDCSSGSINFASVSSSYILHN
jgi:hypothetical protein